MIDRSKFDWKQFDAYRRENVTDNECDGKFASGADMLFAWENAKNDYLAKLFPENQLVLEKRISYERDQEEMKREFFDMIDEFHDFQWKFRENLCAVLDPENKMDSRYYRHQSDEASMRYQCIEMMLRWFSYDRVWENTIEFPWDWQVNHINRYELDIMGHKILLQPGMKLMKTWGKICGWLNLSEEFEQFRLRQSQLTNTKRVNGTVCLSIHPLDYATASDNENGWSSCMSWRERGCYRLGTVEMMNSPMVICSYIKSDKAEMTIGEEPWNSKKWRAWVLVTPEMILMNRQYPYHNDNIGEIVCRWVRELVEENIGWTYNDKFSTDIMEEMSNYVDDGLCPDRICWETNFMYNDIGSDDLGFIGNEQNWAHKRFREYINFSGHAQCMWCGDLIDFDNNQEDADSLGCHLRDHWICEDCGREIEDENDVYYGPNSEVWCSECYNEHCSECDDCGSQEYWDQLTTISFPYSKVVNQKWYEKIKNVGDQEHPLYHWLVGHRWSWIDRGLPVRRDRPSDNTHLCRACMSRYMDEWRSHPEKNINLIHAEVSFENKEFNRDDEWADGENEHWVVDPRTSSFEEAMKFIHPHLWNHVTSDYYRDHEPASYAMDVEQYMRDQWNNFADVLNTAQQYGDVINDVYRL